MADKKNTVLKRSKLVLSISRNKLIDAQLLKKHYRVNGRKIKAVDDATFTIYEGETLGLVGESGSGKTTLGQMIAKLIKPSFGEITFEGENLYTNNRTVKKEIRKNIQMVFQNPYASLNPTKKIGFLMAEPLKIHTKMSNKEINEQVEYMLDKVGLDKSCKNAYPKELSGGQRQRISIAIALMLKPKLVIADEAVSALDISIQSKILNLFNELQEEFNLTYLFISHDLNVIHYISDRIMVMYLGEIVEIAEANELYEEPFHPYTMALINEEGKEVIKGEIPSMDNLKDVSEGCMFAPRCRFAKAMCKTNKPLLRKYDERYVRCHFKGKLD